MKVAVTVTPKAPGRYSTEARAKAEAWGVPFIERELKSPLDSLWPEFDAAMVLGGDGWSLHDREGAMGFSPGLGLVRIKRRASGDPNEDLLIRLLELKSGDSLIDTTLGLASDGVLCADVVGPTGKIIGLEASLPLFLLVRNGLQELGFSNIDVRHGKAIDHLKTFATGSVDCVTIDPMFETPQKASPAFQAMRRFAMHEPLDEETIHEARRVARRWVVIKGGRRGKDFARLGLKPAPLMHRNSPVLWARLPPL